MCAYGVGWIGCRPDCSALRVRRVWRRLTEWHETGVWQELHERLLAELRAASVLAWATCVSSRDVRRAGPYRV